MENKKPRRKLTSQFIEKFIEIVYQKKSIHSFLGHLPPEELEAQALARQHQKVEQQLTLIIK